MTRLRRCLAFAPVAVACAFASLALARGQAAKHDQQPASKAARKSPPKSKTAAPAPPPQPQPFPYTEAIRANNVGLVLMDRRQFDQALGKFQTACILDPQSDVGCLNTGIAFFNMGRFDDARRIFQESVQRDPQSPRAWFSLALLERAAGNRDAALANFQKVAALDPADPVTQYFLGFLDAEAGRLEKASAEFKRALEIDPFQASAEYGLAELEHDSGDAAGAKAHFERFSHITGQGLGKPIALVYGGQGKYSLAGEIPGPSPGPAPPAIPVHFVDVSSDLGLPRASLPPARVARVRGKEKSEAASQAVAEDLASFLGSGACVFDYNGDGRPDIFLVNADGGGNAALLRNVGRGRFVDVTKSAKLQFLGEGTGCAVGDYDNDGHPDLVVSSADGITLFHNQGDATFQDVTDEAGVRTIGLALGVTFVDYDRDGDLDLYVTRFNNFPLDNPAQPFTFPDGAPPPGNTLWRNLGGGTFGDYTKQTGLAGSAASIAALESDLDDDGTIDLVVTGWEKSPEVFVNALEGPFQAAAPWIGETPPRAAGAVAFDFDHDGRMDLAFTHWAPPGLSLWHNTGRKNPQGAPSFERVPLPDPGWMRAWGIAAFDYDNDGWTDLVAVGETFAGKGKILLLRNEGIGADGQIHFRDVTHAVGLDKIVLRNPRSVVAFDPEGDGSADLLITQNGLPPVLLKNVGGSENGWLQLVLKGDPDNRTGIGTRVEILSGARKQFLAVSGASGYLGQSPAEIFTGLGAEEDAADVLRLRWPTGARQNEMQIPGNQRTVIAEQAK